MKIFVMNLVVVTSFVAPAFAQQDYQLTQSERNRGDIQAAIRADGQAAARAEQHRVRELQEPREEERTEAGVSVSVVRSKFRVLDPSEREDALTNPHPNPHTFNRTRRLPNVNAVRVRADF